MPKQPKTPISQISRLPDTEVCRLHDAPDNLLRKLLIPFCFPNRNRRTYKPVRLAQADIFQSSTRMMAMPSSTWGAVEAVIKKNCRGQDIERMNLIAGKALYEGLTQRGASSQHEPQMKRKIVLSQDHNFGSWLPLVVDCSVSEELLIPLVDFRLGHGLDVSSRKFAFSMMHFAVRGASDEYDQAQFVIIDMPATRTERRDKRTIVLERGARFHLDQGQYYSLDELEEMVNRIYRLFAEVLHEEQRKAA